MKRKLIKSIVVSELIMLGLSGCGVTSSSNTITTSSTGESSIVPHEYSQPEFSSNSYSYDKNVSCDLEMPVLLNGVNIYSVYFNDYQLSAKQYEYNEEHKTLNIKESFMTSINKGNYIIKVIFDEEVEPALINVNVMNSVITSFDTSTKFYEFGRTGDLMYDCDFSTASIKMLKKGDVIIPNSYYSVNEHQFILSSDLLDRCFGSQTFELYLSNNDIYSFVVNTDIMFFTDYDITTIHSEIESVYGANPLYQYASSEHVSIVDASEYGMSGRALKYVPNTVDVELDCHAIMTLADVETSMSWYKVGFQKGNSYLISFDYQTIGSSDALGQTFQFATIADWGAPFNYSQNLLLGPENDNKVHHFSIVLTGDQIQSGTFIFAKWLGGSGYLLLDNMRVTKINYPFNVGVVKSYKIGSGDYVVPVTSNGWMYSVSIDDQKVESAVTTSDKVTIPASYLSTLSIGSHKLTFITPVGNYDYELNVTSNGVANLTELSKSFVNASLGVKLNGTFENVTVTKAIKYGQSQFDTSKQDGCLLDINDFIVSSNGLTISHNVLQYIYGTASLKISFSNGDSFNVSLTNSKQVFVSNFNESDVWCHQYNGTATNCLLCQDTSMITFENEGERKHLVYQPKNATLGHSSTPGTHQNGFFTFRRNDNATSSTFWEALNYSTSKTYRITLNYKIEGGNENTKLILYRWIRDASDDKTAIVDSSQTNWSFDVNGNDLAGFYFYCDYKSASDVQNYKVHVYSLTMEEI